MAEEVDGDGGGSDEDLESLLIEVRASRGVDFTGYKRATLRRRLLRRMSAIGVDGDFNRYRDYLRQQPEELNGLFDSVFINVTRFFRDPEAWDHLASEILPRLTARRPSEPFRVWSAGCASGEEPFSIAMLLAERLGLDEYVRRVKIYATDWDQAVLQEARRARYAAELDGVPEPLRHKYFQIDEREAVVHPALRRSIVFGQHDLAADAPISRIDLLTCRNTLMYFNAGAQGRILERLHFALADDGVLFLGRAEMLLTHADVFTPIELKHRFFARAGSPSRVLPRPLPMPSRRRDEDVARVARLREAALDASPVAQIVLDPQHRVAIVNQRATVMWQLGPSDIGRSLQDLELSYRPIDLRSMLDEAVDGRRTVERKDIEYWPPNREVVFLDISVTPSFSDGKLVAITLTFAEVTQHHQLHEKLQHFSETLETAFEELQSANEELETTNEELQSANEELETTNEELQAANEEMDTVNEELRSANDELQANNDRLRDREIRLGEANVFLDAILGTLKIGVAVVGEDLKVRVWNELAADLWGMRRDEVVGQAFGDLDIGLPVRSLIEPINECLSGASGAGNRAIVMAATNRRGRTLQCRVLLTPLTSAAGIGPGVCILMEEANS